MKAILEFNIDDPDELRRHELCVKSLHMGIILWDIQVNGRRWFNNLEEFFEWFKNEMETNGINIESMIR